MSLLYRYDIDVSPVAEDKAEAEAIIKQIPFEIEGYNYYDGKLLCWGESAISATSNAEHHAEIQAALPGKKIASRWRCIEDDPWDDEFDDEADAEEET